MFSSWVILVISDWFQTFGCFIITCLTLCYKHPINLMVQKSVYVSIYKRVWPWLGKVGLKAKKVGDLLFVKLCNYKSQVLVEIEANLPIVFCIGLIWFFQKYRRRCERQHKWSSRTMHPEVKFLTQFMQSIFYTNSCIMIWHLLFVWYATFEWSISILSC